MKGNDARKGIIETGVSTEKKVLDCIQYPWTVEIICYVMIMSLNRYTGSFGLRDLPHTFPIYNPYDKNPYVIFILERSNEKVLILLFLFVAAE